MGEALLCVDIGNTNTVFGLFEAEDRPDSLLRHWRTVTRRDRTSDELGIFLRGFLETADLAEHTIKGFVYSSVVPSFNPIVERMAEDYFQAQALRISHDMGLPINLKYPHPEEIGADRLVNASAAHVLFGGDLIIVDLGTATTFCVMHSGDYLGGLIAPGLKLSIDSLARHTAQLPSIEFKRPLDGVIAKSTLQALQGGFFYGWVGLLREIIQRIKNVEPDRRYQVVATGGLSSLIQREETGLFDRVDPLLTLKGLQVILQNLK